MKNVTRIVQVCIMTGFLIAPVLVLLFYPKQIFSLNENRVLREFQGGWETLLANDGRFGTGLSEYFNDRFQFRDLLIRTKGELEYRIFHITGQDGVYVGDDGYLYYKNVVEREQIANEQLSEGELNRIVLSFENLKKYVNSYGKECLFMIPPQKNEVFPERTPEFHVNRKDPNKYQVLIRMLSGSSASEDFIDVVRILRSAEEKYPTYYKTDFHWNAYGAASAFTEAVNRLAEKEGLGNDIFNDQIYEVYFAEFAGGQLANLPLLEKWKENAVFTRKKTACTIQADTQVQDSGRLHYLNLDTNAPLGKVLFIGDSYTEYMLYSGCGILDLFKEAWFVHVSVSQQAIREYVNQADYVIVERIESAMPNISQEIDGMIE